MGDQGKSAKNPAGRQSLGRGLSALMSDVGPAISSAADPKSEQDIIKQVAPETPGAANAAGRHIAIDLIERNPDQPRKHFDAEKLRELSKSIQRNGVLQPVLVRPLGDGHYQLVAGERRWQAAQNAGLTEIPVLVRELSDRDVLEIGIVENVQRADLGALEEARAYRALQIQFGHTQEEIAKAIGKSRPHVANLMRLLDLPKGAQDMVMMGDMTPGHARAILSAPDPMALAYRIAKEGLSVRAAEAAARQSKRSPAMRGSRAKPAPDPNIAALEKEISDHLGLKIAINDKRRGGSVKITYKNANQLEHFLRRLREST